jgi:PPOX class probable F420-dependent enzyme
VSTLTDPGVRELLDGPNYAVVSTHNADGSMRSTVVWISADDNTVAINSAIGRRWPTNLVRDPRVTVLVLEGGNPYHYVEIRGTATATTEGADEHIDALAKKYTGGDRFEGLRPGDQRIKFEITPEHIRHVRTE